MQEVMYSLVPLAIFILSTLYALCRLRRVHTAMDVDIFRTVSYKNLQRWILKGQSNEIFTFCFYSSFEPSRATDQWIKIFSILVKNSNFFPKKLTRRDSITQGDFEKSD